MTWAARYVGLPFDRAHCWGLVRMVYADQRGIDLPSYGEISAAELVRVADKISAEKHNGDWTQVAEPQAFDVALMRGRARVWHVGIMIDAGNVLHTERATGAVIVPVDSAIMRGRIASYWRHTA
jgi:cell wall-associated NlpC family hydrolase